MKRTIELEVEVDDDDSYADAVAAVYSAVVGVGGEVKDLRFTRASGPISDRLGILRRDVNWSQYSGSVHGR